MKVKIKKIPKKQLGGVLNPYSKFLTTLDPLEENEFQKWYKNYAAQTGNDPNPDDPRHMYDIRGYWKSTGGANPTGDLHLPDTFKLPGHESYIRTDFGSRDDNMYGKTESKYKFRKKQVGGPVSDNTRTVSPAGVPLTPEALAAANGFTALPVNAEGQPVINLAPVNVTAPLNMTKYGMRAENPKYQRVREIEAQEGEEAARRWLYSTQLQDLSTGIAKTTANLALTAGTLNFPIGEALSGATAERLAASAALRQAERSAANNRIFSSPSLFPIRPGGITSNPNYTYRLVAKEGLRDAEQSGIIRNAWEAAGSPAGRAPNYGADVYWTRGADNTVFNPNNLGDNRVLLEIPNSSITPGRPALYKDLSNVYQNIEGNVVPKNTFKEGGTAMKVKIKKVPKKQTGGRVATTNEDKGLGYFKYPNAAFIDFPGSGERTFVPGPFPIEVQDDNGIQILTNQPIKTIGKVRERRIYQEGGDVREVAPQVDPTEATIEAEEGEYILGTSIPNRSDNGVGVGLYYIGGNKHYNGGTKIAANPGDFIFSDDKNLAFNKEAAKALVGKDINKMKDRTPAALVSRYKMFNQAISTAQDSKATPIDRKTALLNIENIYDKLADIAIGQEAIKGFPNGIPQFAQVSLEKRTAPSQQMDNEDIQQASSIPQAKYGGQVKYQQGGALPMTSRSSYYNRGPITANPGEFYYTPFAGVQRATVPHTFDQNINDDGYTNLPTIEIPIPGQTLNPNNPYLWWNQYQFPPAQTQPLTAGPMDRNIWSPTREDYAIPQDFGLPTNDTGTTMNDNGAPLIVDQYTEDVPQYNLSEVPDQTIQGAQTSPLPIPNNSIGTIPTGISSSPIMDQRMQTRNYNSQVNMNPAELYGLIAANKRYPSRYPTAQRYYEGDNIDAILNSSYRPLSTAPYLTNIQRQVNTFTANNSGYGPVSYARNSYAFTQALNAQNQAIGQVAAQNVQRQDQLANALAQNQANKGQMRLNLQDKYNRELETVRNNQELAAKNRMAQTSNLLNAYQRRAMEQRYSNAMMDNFQLDPNGNLVAQPPTSLKNAVLNSTSGSQMSSQLGALERVFKLMQQYGIKSSGFVDDYLKPITGGR